ncbi:MAG TPA: hypothetical protein VF665_14030 [Longimicrobium sp.]|uniref:hypothetical protein n=1 Tax=Longimicrobium sp. TaxID=2029185 RepID=UPI002ED925F9
MAELREHREAEEKAAAAAVSVPTSIASFIDYHLACKAQVGRHRPSERELSLLRTRLIRAARFLHSRGLRDLREITRGDVAAYVKHLKDEVRSAPGAARPRVNYLSPATQGKYLRALSNLLKRALTTGIIHTNFVADLVDEYDG